MGNKADINYASISDEVSRKQTNKQFIHDHKNYICNILPDVVHHIVILFPRSSPLTVILLIILSRSPSSKYPYYDGAGFLKFLQRL